MGDFVVSAIKYRPASFDQVVGQSHIADTLDRAIQTNHLPQVFLFTGPRGVGKTTCARILARRINGIDDKEELTNFSYNVFELDAASNNSVENIRDLVEQVRIPPQIGKYKVYIIDEAHMLSQAAFNAFLKTLEEPPKHVVFILATTEKHKIIPTILSRCQIFEFKRVSIEAIKEQLKKVAESERIKADDEALHLIAKTADGGMRDALFTFDKVVSFCGNHLDRKKTSEALDIVDIDYFFKVVDLALENKIPELLLLFDEVLAKGYDGQNFINEIGVHFRNLLLSKSNKESRLIEDIAQTKDRYFEQSKDLETDFLVQGIDLANSCALSYRLSKNPRLLCELCLMQIASLTFEGIKKKIDL